MKIDVLLHVLIGFAPVLGFLAAFALSKKGG